MNSRFEVFLVATGNQEHYQKAERQAEITRQFQPWILKQWAKWRKATGVADDRNPWDRVTTSENHASFDAWLRSSYQPTLIHKEGSLF